MELAFQKKNWNVYTSDFFELIKRETVNQAVRVILPMAKKIIAAHNGEIKIESEEGKGTTITLKFPIIFSDNSKIPLMDS